MPPTPEYSPSVFSRTMTQFRSSGLQRLSGRVNPGKNAGGAHVGVLIETLANLQPQTPQRDVVGNMRVAGGPEENGVFAAQSIESVLRHHDAVLTEIISTPVEVLEFESETNRRPALP